MDINSGEDHIREEARVWRERAERLQARVEKLEVAVRWALGESPEGTPKFPTIHKSPYYKWRTQLRALADVPYIAATEQGEKDE